jgi:protoporphyrinogen oxidase
LKKKIAIIGAGPAGLTAAYHLAKNNYLIDIYESNSFVGGMSASVEMWESKVDLGPHRFFSSDLKVNNFWLKIIEDEYTMIERDTRIYYNKKFFNYPLKPFNALTKLGIIESLKCFTSYIRTFFDKKKELVNFEDWVSQKFGKKLYEIFFKSYSEKLWGIPCTKLSADFAAQRIKKFSLGEAVKNLFIKKNEHKTLVDEFAYPNGGTGYFYEKLANKIKALEGNIYFNSKIEKIIYQNNSIKIKVGDNAHEYDYLISSMPINNLVNNLDPDEKTKNAIQKLRFRNTLLVYLNIEKENIFDDQWIYVNSDDVKSGRITNFKNWKQKNKPGYSILCFEYWFNDDDEVWKNNEKIISINKSDIEKLNLFKLEEVKDYKIIPIKKCYPIYDNTYNDHLITVKEFLNKFKKIIPIGRYGSFKYNNQDHSILMGMLASEKICKNNEINLWDINTDYEFQEKAIITDTGLRKL